MSKENLKEVELQYKDYIFNIKDYIIDDSEGRIGHGGNGDVVIVINLQTNKKYAAKILRNNDETYLYKTAPREIENMIKCNHPTIMNLLGFSLKDFEDNDNIVILMEYEKNGSLYKLIQGLKEEIIEITNTQKQIILIGIAKGMEYLNFKNIVHRDLKPSNIILDENYHPKIIDLGHSKVLDNSNTASINVGTIKYMAPELLLHNKYSMKSDVYSFGLIMFELITYQLPFGHKKIKGKVKVIDWDLFNEIFDNLDEEVNPEIKELIKQCLSFDPLDRPSFEEIFKKLAFNKDIYQYKKDDKEEDNDESETKRKKYYLEGVNDKEVLLYAFSIKNYDDGEYNIFVNQIKPLKEKNQKLTEEIELIKNKNIEQTNLLNKTFLENEEIKKKIEEIQSNRDKIHFFEDIKSNCIQLVSPIRRENNRLNKNIKELKVKIRKDNDDLGKEIDDLKNTMNQIQEIQSQNDMIEDISKQNSLLIEENKIIKKQIRDIQIQSEQKSKEIESEYRKRIDEIFKIINQIQDFQSQHNQKLNKIESDYTNIIEQTSDYNSNLINEKKTIKNQIQSFKTQHEQKINKIESDFMQFTKQISNQNSILFNDNKRMKNRFQTLQESQTQNEQKLKDIESDYKKKIEEISEQNSKSNDETKIIKNQIQDIQTQHEQKLNKIESDFMQFSEQISNQNSILINENKKMQKQIDLQNKQNIAFINKYDSEMKKEINELKRQIKMLTYNNQKTVTTMDKKEENKPVKAEINYQKTNMINEETTNKSPRKDKMINHYEEIEKEKEKSETLKANNISITKKREENKTKSNITESSLKEKKVSFVDLNNDNDDKEYKNVSRHTQQVKNIKIETKSDHDKISNNSISTVKDKEKKSNFINASNNNKITDQSINKRSPNNDHFIKKEVIKTKSFTTDTNNDNMFKALKKAKNYQQDIRKDHIDVYTNNRKILTEKENEKKNAIDENYSVKPIQNKKESKRILPKDIDSINIKEREQTNVSKPKAHLSPDINTELQQNKRKSINSK